MRTCLPALALSTLDADARNLLIVHLYYVLDSFSCCSCVHVLDRDAFDEDPEVLSFPIAVAEQPELCATAQKRVGEEKLAERLEDVDVI